MSKADDWSQEELNAKIHQALGGVPMAVSRAVWELVYRALPADRRRVVESQDPLLPIFQITWELIMMNPQVRAWVHQVYSQPKPDRVLVICGNGGLPNSMQFNIGDMENAFKVGYGLDKIDPKRVTFTRDSPQQNQGLVINPSNFSKVARGLL